MQLRTHTYKHAQIIYTHKDPNAPQCYTAHILTILFHTNIILSKLKYCPSIAELEDLKYSIGIIN